MTRVEPARRPGRGGHDQAGSAGSVMVVGIALCVAAAFYASVLLIHWFAVARQAQQSAELAALAAAGAALDGRSPCAAAAVAAGHNGVDIMKCLVRGEGRHVVVEVTVASNVEATLPGVPVTVSRSATAAS